MINQNMTPHPIDAAQMEIDRINAELDRPTMAVILEIVAHHLELPQRSAMDHPLMQSIIADTQSKPATAQAAMNRLASLTDLITRLED